MKFNLLFLLPLAISASAGVAGRGDYGYSTPAYQAYTETVTATVTDTVSKTSTATVTDTVSKTATTTVTDTVSKTATTTVTDTVSKTATTTVTAYASYASYSAAYGK